MNANGSVVATSTIGNNQLQNSSVTINSTNVALGGSITISAASSTLLANSNNWTGLQKFANASSTLDTITTGWATNFNATYASTTALTVSGNAYLTGLSSSLLAVNSAGQIVATSSNRRESPHRSFGA